MTMKFRTVKTALETVLNAEAVARNYQVVGYQKQQDSSDENAESDRTVQVYFARGEFPKRAGSLRGPCLHKANFQLILVASASAEGDVATVVNNPTNPGVAGPALAAFVPATKRVDDSWDEFAEHIWQVLMNAQNVDLGITQFKIGTRWVPSIQKDDIETDGAKATLTGTIQFECDLEEDTLGDTGTTAGSIQQVEYNIDEDDTGVAGIIVNQ
jgi:hypothetical protein